MKLADICDINPKNDPVADETLVSFIAMPNVSENGVIDVSTFRPYGEVKQGFTCFKDGDVLFAKITPCMENGKGALAVGLKNGIGCGSTEFHVLRPKENAVVGKWLYYLTAWSVFRVYAERHMTGSAGQKRVPKSFLEKYELTLPSIKVQEQQSAQLDHIKRAIQLRTEQLSTLDDLIKARFVELFGDPITNTKGLETRSLKDVLVLKAGDFTSASDISEEPSEVNKYPCYGGNGIRGYVAEYNQEGNYSLIGRQGALSGNVQYATGKFKNTEHALLVTLAIEMNSIWLNQLLINLDLERYQTGAAQPGLSVKNLQEIQIINVPIDEQDKFAYFVKQVDKSKVAVQKALDEAQVLFNSLMQQYFG